MRYLKKVGRAETVNATTNKEKTLAVLALKKQYSLKHLLCAMNLAKSVFYYHVSALKRPVVYAKELARIESIYHDHKGRYEQLSAMNTYLSILTMRLSLGCNQASIKQNNLATPILGSNLSSNSQAISSLRN